MATEFNNPRVKTPVMLPDGNPQPLLESYTLMFPESFI